MLNVLKDNMQLLCGNLQLIRGGLCMELEEIQEWIFNQSEQTGQ